jgi:hypothetical protein
MGVPLEMADGNAPMCTWKRTVRPGQPIRGTGLTRARPGISKRLGRFGTGDAQPRGQPQRQADHGETE